MVVLPDDHRLTTRTQELAGGYKAYVAEQRTRSLKPTVLVIHENRGLNDHIRDVARRIALEGFRAVAPDMLSLSGGTPANEDAAREAIGKLDLAKATSDAVTMVDELTKTSRGGKVGVVGFCWGGGAANQLAVADPNLRAAVAYYGMQPKAEQVSSIKAPLMLHYAGLDERIDAGIPAFEAALKQNGKTYQLFMYDGADHAFNNDTGSRFDKGAADLAWGRTIGFFRQELG